ncbi:lasso peptide biosynthesis B2 protein [Nocardioides sp. LML1-1-1.1]|uniref:lasso peptide biosynthesis B2 protein n=1 Tax=Nocardioides sp. LML1-1-1.1 TaxID=3135248 RepID=UPI0034369663
MVRLRHRLRVVEALVLVLLARVLRRHVPMRRWSALLGPTGPARTAPVLGRLDGAEVRVAVALRSAAARTGANCLEQAVAASVMMRVRRRPGVVVVGLDARRPDAVPHAWFVGASGLVVTGEDVMDGFRPASQFGPLSSRP